MAAEDRVPADIVREDRAAVTVLADQAAVEAVQEAEVVRAAEVSAVQALREAVHPEGARSVEDHVCQGEDRECHLHHQEVWDRECRHRRLGEDGCMEAIAAADA